MSTGGDERRAGILGAALVLEHVPDLVRYGSKPLREQERLPELARRRCEPTSRRSPIRRTRCSSATCGRRSCGAFRVRGGDAAERRRRRAAAGSASSCRRASTTSCSRSSTSSTSCNSGPSRTRLRARSRSTRASGSWGRVCPGPRRGRVAPGHRAAREPLLQGERRPRAAAPPRRGRASTPSAIEYAIGCGEEAVGDRYQRGGGALAKAIAEACGLVQCERQRREGVLRRAGPRPDRRRRARRVGRLRPGRRGGRRVAREARDEVRGRARPRRARCSRTCSPAWPCSSARPSDARR